MRYYGLNSACSFTSPAALFVTWNGVGHKSHSNTSKSGRLDKMLTLFIVKCCESIVEPVRWQVVLRRQYQLDLMEVHQLSQFNRGIRYLLTCIDIFSKQAWVLQLRTKSSKEVAKAFAKVLVDGVPRRIQTDQGREFRGSPFKRLLQRYGIKQFSTSQPDIKCTIVEHFNRTLRWRLARYLTCNNKSHQPTDSTPTDSIMDGLVTVLAPRYFRNTWRWRV